MSNEELDNAEKILLTALAKKQKEGEQFLLQPYGDGWLIHLYSSGGSKHKTTVGGPDFKTAISKL
jgi:hypothetical protein